MEVVRPGQLAIGVEKGPYIAYFISTNITLEFWSLDISAYW